MSILKKIYNGMIRSRTISAEREIAHILKMSEYRGESEEYVLSLVRGTKL